MKRESKRFRYLGFLICVFLLSAVGLEVMAGAEEKFPTRPLEIIMPTGPGGGADTTLRIVVDAIEPFLGQKAVVINKPGASGIIGTNVIIGAKPDGYTLGCLWNGPLTTVRHVMKVSYKIDDFSYITQIVKGSGLWCVRSEFPAKNAEEFFEYAKKNPGKLTYGVDGIGGFHHLSGERIFHAMKVKLRPIPYADAGDNLKALLGGHVDVVGIVSNIALPHIKAGTIRGIFVTSRERIKEVPEAVGVSELGHPEAETLLLRGIVGPKGIPADRLAILEMAFRQAALTDKVKERLEKMGDTVVASTGKQFEELVRSEAAAMAIIAKEIGLAPK